MPNFPENLEQHSDNVENACKNFIEVLIGRKLTDKDNVNDLIYDLTQSAENLIKKELPLDIVCNPWLSYSDGENHYSYPICTKDTYCECLLEKDECPYGQ